MIDFKLDNKKVTWDTSRPLLTKGSSNIKLNKSEKYGVYSTMGLHLAPADMSGYNVCPKASKGCKKACLTFSGQGQMYQQGKLYDSRLHTARAGKTVLLKEDRRLFFTKLKQELDKFLRKCTKLDTLPAVRLNCTSDVAWENVKDPATKKNIMELYPEIQFYDYTKIIARFYKDLPSNYFLNFSRSESNEEETMEALEMGVNVTAVFKNGLPDNYKGYRVVDGDKTDLRFLDNKIFKNKTGKGVIVGLTPKGWKAKQDTSGFVINSHEGIEFNLQNAA